jgi:hypothetical protein
MGKKCRILPLFEKWLLTVKIPACHVFWVFAVYKAIILLRFSCAKLRLGLRTVDLDLHQGLFALPALGAGRAARGDEHPWLNRGMMLANVGAYSVFVRSNSTCVPRRRTSNTLGSAVTIYAGTP